MNPCIVGLVESFTVYANQVSHYYGRNEPHGQNMQFETKERCGV